ncbi:MAG: ATPase [Deltaproteobacteria bacterium]|nr:ATPase [Deltaproteobacteria bacterium]
MKPRKGIKSANIVGRKGIDTEQDSYLTRERYPDAAVCRGCRSVHHDKKWIHPDSITPDIASLEKEEVVCPACLKIKDKYAEGFVTLEGEFLKEHKAEILGLIRNKEELASHINPLERIIEIKEKDGSIEITTTTEKLAERIGQILKKAFHGEVEYKWSSDTKLARVKWARRDDG